MRSETCRLPLPHRHPAMGIAVALAAAVILASTLGHATVPTPPAANQQITLDGVPLGAPTAFRSSYPTIQFVGGTYHMWVQVQDEGDNTDLRVAGYRHATSSNGIAFTTQGTLSFAGNPFAATIYGSAFGEPPWIYPRATIAGAGATFQFWTHNTAPDVTGDYNYNLSINTIASVNDLALTHYGPVGPVATGIPGQTAGGWGIAGGAMYYDNNSSLGRAPLALSGPGPFPATAGTGPYFATGTNVPVFDPLTPMGLIPCHLPGGTAYVHNGARVLDNGDGTLGFFFTVRNCDGTRYANQVYYSESADNGLGWSNPVGIFPGGVTIGGGAVAGGFALADVVVANGVRVVYFNATDASSNLVVGAMPPTPVAPVAAKPVPASTPASLALLAFLVAASAVWLAHRRRAFARRRGRSA